MKYLFIIFCSFGSAIFHGGHIAEYHFQLEGQNLSLKFMIEKEELMHFDHHWECDVVSMTAICTAKYLNENSSIQINKQKVEFEMQNSYTEGDHLFIILNSKWNGGAIKEIDIQNRCFYEFDHHFKNRIIMNVDRFQKSYLLNREQDEIELR